MACTRAQFGFLTRWISTCVSFYSFNALNHHKSMNNLSSSRASKTHAKLCQSAHVSRVLLVSAAASLGLPFFFPDAVRHALVTVSLYGGTSLENSWEIEQIRGRNSIAQAGEDVLDRFLKIPSRKQLSFSIYTNKCQTKPLHHQVMSNVASIGRMIWMGHKRSWNFICYSTKTSSHMVFQNMSCHAATMCQYMSV